MANTFKFGNGNWAVKKDLVLAYNDENNNFKPLPFDFTRDTIGTYVDSDGLIKTAANNEARIDYTDNANGHLLLEPSRTNLYTYSNDVSSWTKNNVTTTSDYAISPDGTQNAFRAAFSSSTGSLYINALGTTGTDNTLSVWAKSNNGSSNKFRFFGNGYLALSDDYVATDEWQRFEFTYNCTFVTSGLTGASDSSTNDILFYGFQHEVGSYATSYIPTNGQSVTRAAEQGIDGGAGVSIFNNTTAVWFLDLERIGVSTDSSGSAAALRDSSYTQQIRLHFDSPSNEIRFRDAKASFATISTITMGAGDRKKIALRINNTTLSTFADGSKVGSDYTRPTAFDIDEIDFATLGFKLYDMKFYNTALTDAELITLTT